VATTKKAGAGERELLLLGLLRQQEMHGYQLSEFLDAHLGLFFDLKKATAYSLLGKMEARGWVRSREEQEGKRPPRRVYAITEEGETLFQELLRRFLGEYRPAVFPGSVPLLFLHALPPEERGSLLERREKALGGLLEALEDHPDPVGHPLLQHKREVLRAEHEWLLGLIADCGHP
jgi:DNA-binding PadR family transcriptional regulator